MPNYGEWVGPGSSGVIITVGMHQTHDDVARVHGLLFDQLLKLGWLRVIYPQFNNGRLVIEHDQAEDFPKEVFRVADRLVRTTWPASLLVGSGKKREDGTYYGTFILHPAVNLRNKRMWQQEREPVAAAYRPTPVGAYFGKPEGD